MKGFRFNEKYLSQIPALQQLINLGFEYLTPAQALAARQGKTGNVLLEEILRNQLKVINRIQYKGQEYLFTEENIQSAIQKLKTVKWDGLQKTNEAVYDLLTLGTTQEQSIEGGSKSFTLRYVDWQDWKKNAFHVTAEFSVERTRSIETSRPDIVLFVNGISFAVIECKSPNVEVEQAVSQGIRNQQDEYIPKLFPYVQLLAAVNKNAALYATAGTVRKFWSIWQELRDTEGEVNASISKPLPPETKNLLFSGEFAAARKFFDAREAEGERNVTEQDKVIYSLCRPERLLELAYKFITFDGGIKKIARYQQYFVVKSTLERVKQSEVMDGGDRRRKGGIIWHTQGSGKSLTMVWLVRNLALNPDIPNPRIILVTDRIDLDKQLGNTFAACGLDPKRAKTGQDLLQLVAVERAAIITTLIHKFDKALNKKKVADESPDIFILVDESHRTNFGMFAARMRQMFPRACYLGFTGTPLTKEEKNNFVKFGGLIEPHYSIRQAVHDRQVVPLLYEGRHVEMTQNKEAIDLWFERHTHGLTEKQKADLKKKYASAEMLNKADKVIYMRAFDISEHYRMNWQNTPFKAQLVAPGKVAAVKYHEFLNEFNHVTSEVIISPPDAREGYEEVEDEPKDEVVRFWKKMMKRYGSEEDYNKQIISQFKYGDHPQVLVVVDKLITGFDAPRNTAMYLCRVLREHTLLQAIARVNRLYQDDASGAEKEFGYIVDYASILGELDQALTMYADAGLEDFDEADLEGTLTAVNEQVKRLPQVYSDLWDLFKEVKNQYDEDAYEVLLGNAALREDFYQRLAEYSKVLAMAFSTEQFIMNTSDATLLQYRNDLKRFHSLKAAVKLRYAEAIDYRDYEPRIKKLLDTHINANEVVKLNDPVNIFDDMMFDAVKEQQGVYSTRTTGATADAIAHATKKVITEKMEEDPAFYEKFSKLIQQAIDEFRARRISELAYLRKVTDLRNKVVRREHDDVPTELKGNDDAQAFYGVIKRSFEGKDLDVKTCETVSSDTALALLDVFRQNRKVQFWDDDDAKNRVINDIDDFLYDELKGARGITLTTEEMDGIIEDTMQLARTRGLLEK